MKMSNELDDELSSSSFGANELEQAAAGIANLSILLAGFYKSLILNEIPHDLASMAVIEFMRINFPRKAEQ